MIDRTMPARGATLRPIHRLACGAAAVGGTLRH